MASVPVNDLIRLFQKMYKERWTYVWGAAKEGCVDCSGAFDYSFEKLHGINYPHGSNAIARKFIVGGMLPLSQAKPGMAAFKYHLPSEQGYDLPDKYMPGGGSFDGDLYDYYHIGLVDDDVNYVLNAKGTKYGFCRDKLTLGNGWDCVAYLKGVDYGNSANDEKGDIPMQEAKVVLPSGARGDTVNLREAPTTASRVVIKVPVGSMVQVEDDKGQWCKIHYQDKTGWMMSNYIEYAGQTDETDMLLTAEQHAKIDNALKAIEQQIDVIGSIIGRG